MVDARTVPPPPPRPPPPPPPPLPRAPPFDATTMPLLSSSLRGYCVRGACGGVGEDVFPREHPRCIYRQNMHPVRLEIFLVPRRLGVRLEQAWYD